MSESPTKEDISARAMRDTGFRAALIQDPKGTLAREFGMTVPAEIEVTVLEESPRQIYVVLPPPLESRELSDEDLEHLSAAGLGSDPSTCQWQTAGVGAQCYPGLH